MAEVDSGSTSRKNKLKQGFFCWVKSPPTHLELVQGPESKESVLLSYNIRQSNIIVDKYE